MAKMKDTLMDMRRVYSGCALPWDLPCEEVYLSYRCSTWN